MSRPASEGAVAGPAAALDGKVVAGKHGWLFLGHDTNRVLDQHTGRLRFTPRQLEQWRHVLESRVAWLAERGIEYLFVVPPNPHSLYPEHLPDGLRTLASRPVVQLIEHLLRTGSFAEVIYPLHELESLKRSERLYIQTDTHWSELGAFRVYQVLMAKIAERVDVRLLTEEDLILSENVVPGDLGLKVEPLQESVQVYADVKHPAARMIGDNRVRVNGRRVRYECAAAPATTCVLHGDSYCESIAHFFAESFRRFTFAHISTLDPAVVRRQAPDVVIGLLNERFLMRVPDDLSGPSLSELAVSKKARGEVHPPRRIAPTNRIDRSL